MTYRQAPPLRPNATLITPYSAESLGTPLQSFATSIAGAAYPLGNLALYIPFVVSAPINIQSTVWINGTGAGGNCDMGIYDEAGVRLVSLGSTARGAASSTITTTGLTDTVIGPGRYYMGFACDGTSTFFSLAPAAGLCESLGILEQTSAFPLPSPATFALTTRAYIPMAGLYAQTI